MAALTDTQKNEVFAELLREWSDVRQQTPLDKAGARDLLDTIDDEMNSAETAIFQALPNGSGKTWLQANQKIARTIIERIVQKRKKVF